MLWTAVLLFVAAAIVVGLSIAYDLLGLHEKQTSVVGSRWVTVGVMAGACLFALNTESLWDVFYLSGGILTTSVAFPVAAVMLNGISREGVLWSARFGLVGTVVGYVFESRGLLGGLQSSWIGETGLGYILWGIMAAATGYAVGAMHSRAGAGD